MQEKNYNKEEDNKNILLLLGLGGLAYFLLREDKKEITDAQIKDFLKQYEGISRSDLETYLNAQVAEGTISKSDALKILLQYDKNKADKDIYNSENRENNRNSGYNIYRGESENRRELTEADVRRLIEESNQQRETDRDIIEKTEKEKEDETQTILTEYGEDLVKSYDLRELAKEYFLTTQGFISTFRNKLPTLRDSWFDFFNFADADNLQRMTLDTQRNVIDILRFRINELTAVGLKIYTIKKSETDIYDCYFRFDFMLEVANPTSSPCTFNVVPISLKINNISLYPFVPIEYIRCFKWDNDKDNSFYKNLYNDYKVTFSEYDTYLKFMENFGKSVEIKEQYNRNTYTIDAKSITTCGIESFWCIDSQKQKFYIKI